MTSSVHSCLLCAIDNNVPYPILLPKTSRSGPKLKVKKVKGRYVIRSITCKDSELKKQIFYLYYFTVIKDGASNKTPNVF